MSTTIGTRKATDTAARRGFLDRYFGITAEGSTIPRELRAGFTTFLTMSYILFVNPQVLSAAIDVPNASVQLLMTTAIAACFGSLVMGVIARYPFAQAPGMGLNAFFSYTVVAGMGVPWQTALGAVFISGVLFVVLSAVGARRAIVMAIPMSLKLAITAGIGCFLAFLGLRSAGLVVTNEATMVSLGSLSNPTAWIAIIGLLVTAVLLQLKVKGAILWGILGSSVIAIASGAKVYPGADGEMQSFGGFSNGVVAAPIWPSELVGQLDLAGAVGLGLLSVVFTFFFVDFFDATGTLTGLAQRAGYLDERGDMPRAKTTFAMDGLAAMFGAFMGTSTTTAYVESASGIEDGGRTGLTSATTGILFAAAMFLWPLAGAIPGAATAPALILVGALMMDGIRNIAWNEISEGVPSFLAIISMPLTFSIANGVSLGVISYCAIKLFTGKGREVHIILYLVAALLVARYIFLDG
ncbi:AGZA family xanthine/uracil permease-like MFS transporter [Georgenia soli]|uniref:AGZA family xanthine/uracil permease-like MFS transporter n=1 Tax=Georgenia soli TaxID=638953 RepID=A0A2A9EMI8_9MICO|nr:NCS2 family permease [Georgenia soli]PFG39741.1 AGZA family xanthine/uracil permease-like MFS transporter [Georgenia soli]